jgi:hypothetical protein
LGKGSLEVDREREDEMMGNESKGHRRDAIYVQSSVEPETNPMVVVIWRGREAISQKV